MRTGCQCWDQDWSYAGVPVLLKVESVAGMATSGQSSRISTWDVPGIEIPQPLRHCWDVWPMPVWSVLFAPSGHSGPQMEMVYISWWRWILNDFEWFWMISSFLNLLLKVFTRLLILDFNPGVYCGWGIDWVKTLLQLCIVGSCTVGVTENFEEFCKFISRLALKSVAFVGKNALQISMIRQEYLLTLIQLSHFCGWCW